MLRILFLNIVDGEDAKMEEQLISYETALLAIEKGFNQKSEIH